MGAMCAFSMPNKFTKPMNIIFFFRSIADNGSRFQLRCYHFCADVILSSLLFVVVVVSSAIINLTQALCVRCERMFLWFYLFFFPFIVLCHTEFVEKKMLTITRKQKWHPKTCPHQLKSACPCICVLSFTDLCALQIYHTIRFHDLTVILFRIFPTKLRFSDAMSEKNSPSSLLNLLEQFRAV